MVQREMGQIKSYSVGQEKYDMEDLNFSSGVCFEDGRNLQPHGRQQHGSVILKFKPPEVL